MRWKFVVALLFSTSSLLAPLSSSEGWTPELSLKTSAIRRVSPSPDGKQVLIERKEAVIDEESNHFVTDLFIALSDGSCEPSLLFSKGRASFRSAWSPDGRWISFLSDESGEPQLYIAPSDGGEAVQLTHLSEAVLTYLWSPDSSSIAFTAHEKCPSKNGRETAIIADDKAFPRCALWLIDISGGSPRRLTDARYHVRGIGDFSSDAPEFDWSPDGREIAFAHSPRPELDVTYKASSLATLELATGVVTEWDSLYPYESLPRYSPDGRWIAFLHSDKPQTWTITRYVALRSRDGKEVRELGLTPNEGPYLSFSPMVGWVGNSFLVCEPVGTRFSLMAHPNDGSQPIEVDDGKTFFSSVTLNGNQLGLVVEAPDLLPEAFVTGVDRFAPIQISHFNAWAQAIPIAPTEKISWKSVDGVEIEGLLTLPRHYRQGKAVPLLLIVHGGPMAFHRESCIATPYPYSIAAFTEVGFAVLQPNPRGSCGYGRLFRNLNYRDWGGLDYLDLMAGVDQLIDEGIADANRLGIMGWSYGGYMTMWAITQTHRFRAASAGAGICNLVSFAGTNDIPSFLADYFGGELWEERALYLERSPLTHIQKVKTPCLIQSGSEDRRTPMGQSEEFYQALKRRNIETRFVIYPRAGHGPREPKQLLDSMERNLDWFVSHIKSEQ